MTTLSAFLWGFGGSVAVEIVSVAQQIDVICDGGITLPARYGRCIFYIIRLLLATIAGGLAVAYQIDRPLLAINIGASTPLIVQALAQGVPAPSVIIRKKATDKGKGKIRAASTNTAED